MQGTNQRSSPLTRSEPASGFGSDLSPPGRGDAFRAQAPELLAEPPDIKLWSEIARD